MASWSHILNKLSHPKMGWRVLKMPLQLPPLEPAPVTLKLELLVLHRERLQQPSPEV